MDGSSAFLVFVAALAEDDFADLVAVFFTAVFVFDAAVLRGAARVVAWTFTVVDSESICWRGNNVTTRGRATPAVMSASAR